MLTFQISGKERMGSIGVPIPSTEIQMMDDDGNALPFGEAGELCARGPQVFKGYWQKDNSSVFHPGGWFKTGDIAVMDADGYIKIVDRKKDMILVSGFNVYPNEIEGVVAGHPKVLEVAAIGVPDPQCGEAVKIVVVKKDQSLTEEELVAFCKENLTGYKRPKLIEFKTEIPKTNVGKILRRALRKLPLPDLKGLLNQFLPEVLCCMALSGLHHLLWCPFKNQIPSFFFSTIGTKIDDPVGAFDHLQIVLDNDHSVAKVDESIDSLEELGYIMKVKSCRWLIKDEHDMAVRRILAQERSQLHSLGLAATERIR